MRLLLLNTIVTAIIVAIIAAAISTFASTMIADIGAGNSSNSIPQGFFIASILENKTPKPSVLTEAPLSVLPL